MNDLSDGQIGTVRKMIEQAPDATLRSIGAALAANLQQPAAIRAITDIVNAEALEREVRTAVFAPIAPLCTPTAGVRRLEFPFETPALLWRALKTVATDAVAQATHMAEVDEEGEGCLQALDELCREAATALRDRATPELGRLAAWLDGKGPGSQRLATLLDLSPLLREALPSLPYWARNLNGEYDASIRVVFKQASDLGSEGAALLMEALFAHLEDPYHVLRLVSSVMSRPSERYLAACEMATFGERLMDDIDRQIELARGFDPLRGLEGGVAAAAAAEIAIHGIPEFEEWVILSKQGPWGSRLQAQKRSLALIVEARLREVEGAVAAALPVQTPRFGAHKQRGAPRIADQPNPLAVAKAQALLALLHGVRSAASIGGFGALRTKLIETLTYRLDQYTEDLLDLLHSGQSDPDRVRAYLEVAAEFTGLVQDPQAAEIVRRRAAAA